MRIINVKNLTNEYKDWETGRTFLPNEEYQIPSNKITLYSENSVFLSKINTEVQIGNCDYYFDDYNQQLNWLKGNIPQEVIPTAPKNEYELRPYGLTHAHINSSDQIYDITLANKNGMNIDYSNCSVVPQFYDCIFQQDSVIRDGVISENDGTITTFMGRLQEGSANLSRPVDIDYKIETIEDVDTIFLWGIFIDIANYGDDDMIRLQICDPDGIGVYAGLYTQEELEGMNYIVKEYDECWTRHMAKIVEINTPDGSPGEIVNGMVLRIKYYCKDITKTDIKVWADYKITIKDS